MTAGWREWRDPLRMTVAAVVALALAEAAHLPEAYWAVLSALIVTRPHLGATMSAAAGRLVGTIAGAALAVAVASLRIWHVPELALLAATLAPLGVLIAWRSEYRTAPVAAVIVLSATPDGGSALGAAGLRVAEIALGAAVGALVAFLLLRTRGAHRAERIAARLVERAATLLAAGTEPAPDPARLERLRDQSRADLRELVIVSRTARWERDRTERTTRLYKLTARLDRDVAFFVDAARSAPDPARLRDATARLQEGATRLAGTLAQGVAPQARAPAAETPADPAEQAAAFRFLLRTIGRDLRALGAFLAEAR